MSSALAARHKHDAGLDEVRQTSTPQGAKDTNGTIQTPFAEAVRPVGHTQLYKYYFAASGWPNAAAFFLMIMSFAFFTKFPGETGSRLCGTVHALTIFRLMDEVLDFRRGKAWQLCEWTIPRRLCSLWCDRLIGCPRSRLPCLH